MASILRNVRLLALDGDEPKGLVDLAWEDGRITALGESLPTTAADQVWDAQGRWAMPGLWDAHTHFRSWALGLTRLDLSGAADADQVLALVRQRLGQPDLPEVLAGAGYRASLWPVQPSVAALDAVAGERPVILASGDGHSAWFDSAALRLFGLPPRDGVVQEGELFALAPRLWAQERQAGGDQPLRAAQERAAAQGVVGIVDFEFEPTFLTWPERYARVGLLKVVCSTYPDDLDRAIGLGLATGQVLAGRDGGAGVVMGALKIISDGSLNSRTAHCFQPYAGAGDLADPCGVQSVSEAELGDLLRRATAAGLQVALHAIGDAAVAIAVDQLTATGAAGTIEHAQLLRWEDLPRLAATKVAASVQPAHLLDDRQPTLRLWPDRTDRCFPRAALGRAGVELRLGSDAPVSPLDPWLAMAAAVHRGDPDDPPWNPRQALTVRQALAASVRSRVAVGQPADVVLLDEDVLALDPDSAAAARRLRATAVAATFVAGVPATPPW
ncbi:MAG: amidohydrolase family protein [Propionibacteriaceae bacterium]|jgi:predicted amidohydrolase YtcJ|nr:amidohydrolase family protein [Propionibacteriaceae bacterium]